MGLGLWCCQRRRSCNTTAPECKLKWKTPMFPWAYTTSWSACANPPLLISSKLSKVLLCHLQIMLLIQGGTVSPCRSSLLIWKQLSGLIHFGLAAPKRSSKVLVNFDLSPVSWDD